MSDGSPLKIRTMADDLERARKGEISFASPVSDVSIPLKIQKKYSSQSDFGGREKKSLKDVLTQLGEGEDNLELPKDSRRGEMEIKRTEEGAAEEIKKEAGGKIESGIRESGKSDIRDVLKKMDGLAQRRPVSPAPFSAPAPKPFPPSGKIEIKESRITNQESRIEPDKLVLKKDDTEGGLDKAKKEHLETKNKIAEEKSVVEKEGRKSENIREMKEEIGLLRDQEETRGEIAEMEKELEEKKKEFKEIKERKKRREGGGAGADFAEREKRLGAKRDALKEIEEAAREAAPVSETPYLSPGARLLYNKPEYHSSALNKVREKKEETKISGLEKTLKSREPSEKEKKKTPDQEYRQFKKSLKNKYQSKLKKKTSKRLTFGLAGIAIVGIAGALVWFLILNKPQPTPPSPPSLLSAAALGIEKFSSMSDEIVINLGEDESAGLIAKINAQAARLEREGRIAGISRVIVKKGGAAVPLGELLGELKIEMTGGALDFFDDNRYNLFLFKEKSGVKRLGLALAADNPSTTRLKFQSWESENISSRKIYRAFEPLFLGSRISSVSQEEFKTGEYLGVKMRYLQIPDQNTSLDYLIYGDILVITTSKDSIFQVIEILISY